jgi:hypothetical protein
VVCEEVCEGALSSGKRSPLLHEAVILILLYKIVDCAAGGQVRGMVEVILRLRCHQITGMGALPTTSPVTQGDGVTIYTMLKALR